MPLSHHLKRIAMATVMSMGRIRGAILILLMIGCLLSFAIQVSRFVTIGGEGDPLKLSPAIIHPQQDDMQMGDTMEHTIVLMQISDIHISINFDPSRGPDLETFCTQVLDAVNPKVLIVSGDLTDAMTRRLMYGNQFEEEWIQYRSIIDRTNAANKTLWLDMRGNHDTFNVFSWESDNNYWKKYSIQGPHFKRHYIQYVEQNGDLYAFIAVDACLAPGPNRPHNLNGLLHPEDITMLEQLRDEALQRGVNMTIWFGHYPTPAINGPQGHGLREVINGPYLSGHIHMNDLYAVQPRGFLDIELADWKNKRKFRIMAIDHGIFAFNDMILGQWPMILITNPKPAMFLMPKMEPTHRILNSTHIRVLVFGGSEDITSVSCQVNDGPIKQMNRIGSTHLYVIPWDPKDYLTGLHIINVMAKDASGRENNSTHEFSFDGSKPSFKAKARFIMNWTHQAVWGTFFFICIAGLTIPFLALRFTGIVIEGPILGSYAKHPNGLGVRIFMRFYLMCSVDRIFFPLMYIVLYSSFGPWGYGEIIDGHYGWFFSWGIWLEGNFIPGGITLILSILYFIVVQSPTVCLLSHCVFSRYQQLLTHGRGFRGDMSFRQKYVHGRHFLLFVVFALHLVLAITYADSYGFIGFLCGFMHTWTLFIHIYLWYSSLHLTFEDFAESSIPKEKVDTLEIPTRQVFEEEDLLKDD